MKKKDSPRIWMYVCLLTTLLCIFPIAVGVSSVDASIFDPNKISIVHNDIRVLDGTWIANSDHEALTVVETEEDHEIHLGILQKDTKGYSVVSMSSGIISSADYYSSPHQLLDHMKDGHPYFDVTTANQWLYIELGKNDAGEWLVSSLLIEDLESGERLTCNYDVDTRSVWVYSIAYPRINWPFLHDELILDHFDISSFASECKRALSFIEEKKRNAYDCHVLEIEW